MPEILIQAEVTTGKGDIFHQFLIKTPFHEPGDIILKSQEEVQLTELVPAERVALAIGMLSGILPQGDLRENALAEFNRVTMEGLSVGNIHQELLNLAIALASYQDYVASQKIQPVTDDIDFNIRSRYDFDPNIRLHQSSADQDPDFSIQVEPTE